MMDFFPCPLLCLNEFFPPCHYLIWSFQSLQPCDTKYLLLDDGWKLCLECLDFAIMDTHECQPLYLEIQEFYEGLNMKVEQQVPMLLVERQALNEVMEGEKNVMAIVLNFHKWNVLFFQFSFLSNVELFFVFVIEYRVITTCRKLEDSACQKSRLSPL